MMERRGGGVLFPGHAFLHPFLLNCDEWCHFKKKEPLESMIRKVQCGRVLVREERTPTCNRLIAHGVFSYTQKCVVSQSRAAAAALDLVKCNGEDDYLNKVSVHADVRR